jgi:hypothetical protein
VWWDRDAWSHGHTVDAIQDSPPSFWAFLFNPLDCRGSPLHHRRPPVRVSSGTRGRNAATEAQVSPPPCARACLPPSMAPPHLRRSCNGRHDTTEDRRAPREPGQRRARARAYLRTTLSTKRRAKDEEE